MKFKSALSEELDFSTPGITTGVVDEHGKAVVVRKRNPERKAGTHCKRVLKTIFIQIGLCLILIGYLIAGGFLFRALELDNESSLCYAKLDGYLQKLNSSASRVIGIVESTIDADRRERLVREIMVNFADQLFILDFQPTTDCSNILNTEYGARWNLANAIYFCATIITTIGYGHITPLTFRGRISCIVYALIGIPLMLIYLAIIGSLLARVFRVIYVNIICCRCFFDNVRRKRQKRRERLLRWEQDLRQHEQEEARRRGLPVPPPKVQPIVLDEDEDALEQEEISGDKIIAVPLTVSIIVLTCYTLIGAILFPRWEDWSLVDSAYFSFITISTIGFGDLVPGTGRLNEPETVVELMVGALYLIIGLALVSMCINLLQDEIVAKIKYIANCCNGRRAENDEDEVQESQEENSEKTHISKQIEMPDQLVTNGDLPNEAQLDEMSYSAMNSSKPNMAYDNAQFGMENAGFVTE